MGLKVPWGAIPVQVRILPRASSRTMKRIAATTLLLAIGIGSAAAQAVTESAPQDAMRSDLRKLVVAEEVYFADSVKYTADLRALSGFFRLTAGVPGLTITLTGDGWTGSVGPQGTATGCVIYVGSTAIGPATQEGKPVCRESSVPADTVAARAAIDAGNARWIAAFQRADPPAASAPFPRGPVQVPTSGA